MHVLPSRSDQLDLRLQPHPESLLDTLLHVRDQLSHVSRSGSSGIHKVVRVHRRDLRPSHGEALESGGLDQLARGPRTILPLPAGAGRVLEYTAAARLIEWRSALAPFEHFRHRLLQAVRLLWAEPDRRLEHDSSIQPTATIGKRNFPPGQNAVSSGSVDDGHA